jgi:hypothetical protein
MRGSLGVQCRHLRPHRLFERMQAWQRALHLRLLEAHHGQRWRRVARVQQEAERQQEGSVGRVVWCDGGESAVRALRGVDVAVVIAVVCEPAHREGCQLSALLQRQAMLRQARVHGRDGRLAADDVRQAAGEQSRLRCGVAKRRQQQRARGKQHRAAAHGPLLRVRGADGARQGEAARSVGHAPPARRRKNGPWTPSKSARARSEGRRAPRRTARQRHARVRSQAEGGGVVSVNNEEMYRRALEHCDSSVSR